MAMLNGVVKGVLSGDTLIIMGVPPPDFGRYPITTPHAHARLHFTGADASKGPPPEKQISLTGVASPRLGNRNGTPDQPFAWAAREFLRKSVIGKRVTFRVESATPTGREMGAANLEDGTSIAALLVSNGWAKVTHPSPCRSLDAPRFLRTLSRRPALPALHCVRPSRLKATTREAPRWTNWSAWLAKRRSSSSACGRRRQVGATPCGQ